MIQRYQPYPFFWFVQPYSTLKQKRVPNHDVGGKKNNITRALKPWVINLNQRQRHFLNLMGRFGSR